MKNEAGILPPLPLNGWGGRRRGAGRKRRLWPVRVRHKARPFLAPTRPVLIRIRVRREIWSLRTRRCYSAVHQALLAGCDRFGFRLIHFSVQRDHIHLIVHADDKTALTRGMQGLAVRIAKAINRVMKRRGPVFADRYRASILQTTEQLRWAVGYVLQNAVHHFSGVPQTWIDPCSSALMGPLLAPRWWSVLAMPP